jgi:outer membrane protein assembly factor BamB
VSTLANAGAEIGRLSVQYPGGIAARFRWGGSGRADEVFAISESSGTLTDYAELAGEPASNLCRAELRVESPQGAWTARFASVVFDEPQGVLWATEGLLLVKYGFRVYALNGRTGQLAWSYGSGTPTLAVLASSRLNHVLLQTELETMALRANGEVAWRAAHDDVITEAQLVAGRLDLTTYGGQHLYLDAQTGQQA